MFDLEHLSLFDYSAEVLDSDMWAALISEHHVHYNGASVQIIKSTGVCKRCHLTEVCFGENRHCGNGIMVQTINLWSVANTTNTCCGT
jgi:hypothetical protein